MELWKATCLLAAIAAFCNLFVSSQSWAAAIDCSGTKKSKAALYKEVIRPGDHADHEMILAVRTHVISSKDPDFDGSEQTVYALHDEYAHAGTQTGYFLYTLKSGEKIWAKFDSVNSMTGTRDSWEVTYQGIKGCSASLEAPANTLQYVEVVTTKGKLGPPPASTRRSSARWTIDRSNRV